MPDLIDRNATIEAYCADCCSMFGTTICENDGMCRDIDVLKKIPTVNRWIPCSEMLPEIDRDVLVYYPYWKDNPIQVAHLEYDSMYFELSDGEYNLPVNAVTHWMTLPELPERK